jgi:predicted metal-dependent phosphoesterase TrpH
MITWGEGLFPSSEAEVTHTPQVDLHAHSTASDGTLSPAELVRLAHARGLHALALTDHDTLAGVAEAKREADALGVRLLPGIEVSTAFPRPGTMHLLGYGLDVDSPAARYLAETLEAARAERTTLILRRLSALGIDLSEDELLAESNGGNVGRPHVAALLVRHAHTVSTRDAFDRLIGGGGAAFVENNPFGPERVIELVRAAGGMVSLAHPLQLRRTNFTQVEALIRELADQGMEGLETIHGSHDTETVHRLTRLADRLGLLTTGGSDFHGGNKPWIRLGEAGGRIIPRGFYDDVMLRVRDREPAVKVAAPLRDAVIAA